MAIAVDTLNKKVKSHKSQVDSLLIFILNLLHYIMHYKKKSWSNSFSVYATLYNIWIHLLAVDLPLSWAAIPLCYSSFLRLFWAKLLIFLNTF